MSLEKQLADLRARRDQHLKTLHLTYIHTKRDARRALSPDRIIRKHLGASLGLAAIAGLLLAPRPRAKESPSAPHHRRSSLHIPGWLQSVVKKFVPQAAAVMGGAGGVGGVGKLDHLEDPGAAGDSADSGAGGGAHGRMEKSPRSMLRHFLMEIGMMVLGRINLRKLVPLVYQALATRFKGGQEMDGKEIPHDGPEAVDDASAPEV